MSATRGSGLHLPPGVRLGPARGGLPAVRVDTPQASAEIYLHGAHVTAWRPTGHRDVLWVSDLAVFDPAKAIRGGVPICFPWFAGGIDGTSTPAHGFARTTSWEFTGATDTPAGVEVVFALSDSPATRALWPHAFTAVYRVVVGAVGPALTLTLTVTNTGDEPFTMEEALHAYFAVGDIRDVAIDGLAGAPFLDTVPGADIGPHVQDGPIRFTRETDRTYQGTTATAHIRDGDRAISVVRDGSRSTIVWNPWVAKSAAMSDFGDEEWTGMVCVETANAKADAVTMAPGAVHAMTAIITVD